MVKRKTQKAIGSARIPAPLLPLPFVPSSIACTPCPGHNHSPMHAYTQPLENTSTAMASLQAGRQRDRCTSCARWDVFCWRSVRPSGTCIVQHTATDQDQILQLLQSDGLRSIETGRPSQLIILKAMRPRFPCTCIQLHTIMYQKYIYRNIAAGWRPSASESTAGTCTFSLSTRVVYYTCLSRKER
jgi:hypothetical protein